MKEGYEGWGEDWATAVMVPVATVGMGGATVEVGVVTCFRKFCFSFF